MTEGRSRGWLGVAGLAVATAVLSVVQPALLIFIPLALLFVALPPRRPVLLALAGFIGWLVFRTGPGDDALWHLERGWAMLLGAWFVVFVALAPGWRFLSRALAAVGATAATAAIVLAVKEQGFSRLDAAVGEQIRGGAATALGVWSGNAGFERVGEQTREMVMAVAELQARVYPALLGLASLAALGIAWWAFGRLARGERHPLGRLREFRFRDELVWLLIAGLVLLVLPLSPLALDALATRAGQNLLTFMAALYALRGLAVMIVVSGVPGPFGLIVGALLIVFLYPFVMATAFLVGLSDTWLDIRARRLPSSPGS